jgi:ribosome-binding factor A
MSDKSKSRSTPKSMFGKNENRGASHRIARVEKEVREVVGIYLISGFRGELPGIVSVTRVIVSHDLRTAKILVSLMADESLRKAAVATLQSEAHEVQAEVNRKLRMKFVPRITFHYDDGFDNALKIENILRDISRTSSAPSEAASEASSDNGDSAE